MKKIVLFLFVLFYLTINCSSQTLDIPNLYFKISAGANDPLYTTYAAPMERSTLFGDKAYKMDYYSECFPINYTSDKAGKMFCIWKVNNVAIDKISEYYKKPIVIASFPDMAVLEYEPYPALSVQETFLVYSSSITLVNINIKNNSNIKQEVDLYPIMLLPDDSLQIKRFDDNANAYITQHYESRQRAISNLEDSLPYPTNFNDVFMLNMVNNTFGGYKGGIEDFYSKIKNDYYDKSVMEIYPSNIKSDSLNCAVKGFIDYIVLHSKIIMQPGEQRYVRYLRGTQDQKEDLQKLITDMEQLRTVSLQSYINSDVNILSKVPAINFFTKNEKLIYLSALNLARGSMFPPTLYTKYNSYVFTRNPIWSWGYAHQSLQESISMLGYSYIDPVSAENSQRVYIEQQYQSGFIGYSVGPLGNITFPNINFPNTTGTPFFSWINWEIYKVSKDKEFLEYAYNAGENYINWIVKNFDKNRDGLYEWGQYSALENGRTRNNAVYEVTPFRALDAGSNDIGDSLDCLDLNCMVVKEMRSLSNMAKELGKDRVSRKWTEKADYISQLINENMWDKTTGFYYSINKDDHSFKFQTRDLRNQEIAGFLPLWAEATTKERADSIVKVLTNPKKFWREYGIPSLAADDSLYNPNVDACFKWDGPVYLHWNYIVYQGLMNYGYKDIAKQLAVKMLLCVSTQLSKNHNFWESFSPDNTTLNSPSNYIWDSIMAKLLIDMYGGIK